MRSGSDGQQRLLATGLHGREVARFEARRGVSDPEDTAMNADEGTGAYAGFDFVARDAGVNQLLASDDAMRAVSKLPENPVDRPALCRHQRY